MNYTIIRSQRKTCAIQIRRDCVEVRAPFWLPVAEIDRFVTAKSDWISAKLTEQTIRAEQRAGFSLYYGDMVLYRGDEYPIIVGQNKRVGISEYGFYMPRGLSAVEIKSTCVKIYRSAAKAVLTEKANMFSAIMGVSPSVIRITGAKTRWGSCSSKKSINFSWRLIMANDDIIDYVVVHELAHLKEMNHSPRFWAVVESVLPDYNNRRRMLKDLQKRLCVEDWD